MLSCFYLNRLSFVINGAPSEKMLTPLFAVPIKKCSPPTPSKKCCPEEVDEGRQVWVGPNWNYNVHKIIWFNRKINKFRPEHASKTHISTSSELKMHLKEQKTRFFKLWNTLHTVCILQCNVTRIIFYWKLILLEALGFADGYKFNILFQMPDEGWSAFLFALRFED